MDTTTELEAKAFELGRERGASAGSWVVDGNTSDETKRAIINGYNDGDPAVLNMEPAPLSGEWGDDPTISDVLAELGIGEDEEYEGDLLTEYESGFSDGFWGEVIRSANAMLADEN
jgi:hypothetical protein